MVSYLGAVLIILCFSFLFDRLRLAERARDIPIIAKGTLATLGDKGLGDDAKEAAMRRDSKALFVLFGTLTAGLVFALGLPMLIAFLIGYTGFWSFDSVVAASMSLPFILGGLAIFLFLLVRPGRRSGR